MQNSEAFYKNRQFWLLLLLASALRIWGITYGLPATYNSTEYFIAKHALSLGARQTLEPLYFIYPTLFTYLMAGVYGVYFVVGRISGHFQSATDFALEFLFNPYYFYLLGRVLTAIISILSVALLYRILINRVGKQLTFFGTLAFLSLYNVQFFTRWMVPDALLILGTITVFYFILNWEEKGIENTGQVWVPAIITGLTISAKYNAGFLALGLLIAVGVFQISTRKRLQMWGGALIGIFLGFIIGTPYWILSFDKFWAGFRTIWSQSHYAYNFQSGTPYFWEMGQIIKTEFLLGIFLLFGLIQLTIRPNRKYWPFWMVVLPTFLLVGSWQKKGLDYMLIIFPVLILYVFLNYKEKGWHEKFKFSKLFLIGLILPSLFHVGYLDFLQSRQDTRQLASDWIVNNIPSGTKISYDHYYYDLNIVDIYRFLEYGAGARFLDEPIKQKIKTYEKSPRNYRLISVQYHLPEPLIPDTLSAEMKRIILKDPYLQEQFQNPFKSLEELKNEGVQWLILNSDTYLKFIQNPLPSPDNPLRIFFVQKRQFYREIDKAYQPVKIFVPRWNRPGPIIKIYRLL